MSRPIFFASAVAFVAASTIIACLSNDDSSSSPSAAPDGGADALSDAPIAPGDRDAGDANGPEDDLGDLGAFCTQYASGGCARRKYCWNEDDTNCEASELSYCREYARAEILPAIHAGLVTFDAAQAAKCLATPMSDYCQGNNYWSLADCQHVLKGTVPNGGKCFSLYFYDTVSECSEGSCSQHEQMGHCQAGTCSPWLTEGAPCRDADAGTPLEPGCGPGLRCSDSNRCAKEGNPGDPCTDLGELCRSTYPMVVCAPLADGGAGYACDFPRSAGGACGANGIDVSLACRTYQCVNGQCIDNNDAGAPICESNEVRCPSGTVCTSTTPRSCGAPRATGEACVGDECGAGSVCTTQGDAGSVCTPLPEMGAACNGRCASGLACSAYGDAGMTCASYVGKDGACRGPGDDTCAAGLTCNAASKTCVPLASNGAACATDTDCQRGLYCDGSACHVWKTTGTACTRDGECAYGQGCIANICSSTCIDPR